MISLNIYNLIIIFTLISSFITAYLYRFIWNNFLKIEKIPQGYGLLITYYLVFVSLILNFETKYIYSFFSLMILTSIYWIDDIKSLSAKSRIFIQSLAGFIIYFINSYQYNEKILIILLSLLFFVILSIYLTNIINFYDGLDLNLSVFIIINSTLCMYIFNNNFSVIIILSTIITFVCTFSIFNSKKNNLFFGDSGCYAFAGLLLFLICLALNEKNLKIFYLIIGLSLPVIDTTYVLIYRILKRESLLTRNYYHLYQRFEKILNNKSYLFLQIINSLAIILILYFVNIFYYINIYFIIVISFGVTIIIYILSSIFINEFAK